MSQRIYHNENQKIFLTTSNENMTYLNFWDATNHCLRKMYSFKSICQKKRMAENQCVNIHFTKLKKE